MVEAKSAATATSVPVASHSSGNGPCRAWIKGSATEARTRPPATASTAIAASQLRNPSPDAFARSWNMVTNPRIEEARVR
jgi:prephenate dehydratase